MNSFIREYRKRRPGDARTDEQIVTAFGDQLGVDAFSEFPDFQEDYQRVKSTGTPMTMSEEERRKIMSELYPPTVGDYVKQGVGSFGRALVGMAASVPEGIAIGANALGRATGTSDKPVSEMETWKWGTALRRAGEAITPAPVEALQGSFIADTVPAALGSMAGFVGGGVAGTVAKLPRLFTVAGMGSVVGAVDGYHDAVANGADEDTAFKSFLLNGGVGASEIMPISGMLKRLDKLSGGTLRTAIVNAGKETLEEAIQEAMQGVSGNYIAQRLLRYDKDRELFSGIAEQAGAGAVSGALMSFIVSAVGGKMNRIHEQHKKDLDETASQARPASAPAASPVQPAAAPAVAPTVEPETADVAAQYAAPIADYAGLAARSITGTLTGEDQATLSAMNDEQRAEFEAALNEIQSVAEASRQAAPQAAPAATPAATPEAAPPVAPPAAPPAAPPPVQAAPPIIEQPLPAPAAPLSDEDRAALTAELLGMQEDNEPEPDVAAPPAPPVAPPVNPPVEAPPQPSVEEVIPNGQAQEVQGQAQVAPKQIQKPTGMVTLFRGLPNGVGVMDRVDFGAHFAENRDLAGKFGGQDRVVHQVRANIKKPVQVHDSGNAGKTWDSDNVVDSVIAQYPELDTAAAETVRGGDYAELEAWLKANGIDALYYDDVREAGGKPAGRSWILFDHTEIAKEPSKAPVEKPQPKAAAPAPVDVTALVDDVDWDNTVVTDERTSRGVNKGVSGVTKQSVASKVEILDGEFAGEIGKIDEERSDAEVATVVLDDGSVAEVERSLLKPMLTAAQQAELKRMQEEQAAGKEKKTNAVAPAYRSLTDLPSEPTNQDLLNAGVLSGYRAKGTEGQAASKSNTHRYLVLERGGQVFILPSYQTSVKARSDTAEEKQRVKELSDLVRVPNVAGGEGGTPAVALIKAGFKPLATLMRRTPANGSKAKVQSMTMAEWNTVRAAMQERMQSAQSYAAQSAGQESAVQYSGPEGEETAERVPTSQPQGAAAAKDATVSIPDSLAETLEELVDAALFAEKTRKVAAGQRSLAHVIDAVMHEVNDKQMTPAQYKQFEKLMKSVAVLYDGNPRKAYEYLRGKIARAFTVGKSSEERARLIAAGETWNDARGDFDGHGSVQAGQPGGVRDGVQAVQTAPQDGGVDPAKQRPGVPLGWDVIEAPQGLVDPRIANAIFRSALNALLHAGVDVAILTDQLRQVAAIRPGRAVALAVGDVTKPDDQAAVMAVHELAHDLVDKLPVDQQNALHRAIDNLFRAGALDPATVSLAMANEGGASKPEEMLVEQVSRDLVSQGFDPERAGRLSERLMRSIKQLWTRVMMAIQRSLLGNEHEADALALQYFKLRMESLLAGSPMQQGSWLAYLLGPRNVVSAANLYQEAGDEQGERIWLDRDGVPRVAAQLPSNVQGVLASVAFRAVPKPGVKMRAPVTVSAQQPLASDNLERATFDASLNLAATRHLQLALEQAHAAALESGKIPQDMTLDQFAGSWISENASLDTPAAIEAATQVRLEQLGAEKVSEELRIVGGAQSFQNEASYMQSLAQFTGLAKTHRSSMVSKRTREAAEARSINARLKTLGERIPIWAQKYQDAEWVSGNVLSGFRSLVSELRKDVRQAIGLSHKSGILAQQVKGLMAEASKAIPDRYVTLFDGIVSALSKSESTLFDFMQEAAALNIDWRTLPIKDIGKVLGIASRVKLAMANHPMLKGMTAEQQDMTIALVSAWAKQNDHAMALLEVRSQKRGESAKEMQALLKSASESVDTDLNQAYAMARSMPHMAMQAQRILDKLKTYKREQAALDRRLKQINQFKAIQDAALPVIDRFINEADSKLGAAEPFFVEEGATLHVPPSPTATPAEIEQDANLWAMKLTGEGATTAADVHEVMAKIKAWLDVNLGKGGKLEGKYDNALRALSMHNMHRAQYGNRQGLVGKVFGSVSDVLERTGTKGGARAAVMLRRYVSLASAHERDAVVDGRKVDAAKGRAMRKLHYKDPRSFMREFHHNAFGFWTKNRQLQERGTPDEVRDVMLKAWRNQLMENQDHAKRLDRAAWDALVTYYDAVWTTNDRREKTSRAMGNRVNDPVAQIQRHAVGDPKFTMPQGPSHSFAAMANNLMNAGWAGTSVEPLKFSEVVKAYEEGKLEELLGDRFKGAVWKEFVLPMANRETRSLFSGHRFDDGTYSLAKTENVRRAAELANGNPVAFAEALAKLEGISEQDLPAFVAETMDTFQNFAKNVIAVQQDRKASEEHMGQFGAPHYLMDARLSEEWPNEWLEFDSMGENSSRLAIHRMALHAGLGRDAGRTGNGFLKAIADAQTELQLAAEQWQKLVDTVRKPNMTASAIESAAEDLARKSGKSKRDIALMKNAADNAAVVTKASEQTAAWFKVQASDMVEAKALLNWISTIAGLMVNGPKSALLNTTDMLVGPALANGISRTMLKRMALNWTAFAGEAVGSMFGAVGAQFQANADYHDKLQSAGLRDPDLDLSAMDWITAGRSGEVALNNRSGLSARIAEGATRAAQLVRMVTQLGLKNRAGTGYSTVKLAAPFSTVSNWMNRAMIIGTWRTYETMGARAVEYLRNHPEAAADPNFKFNAKGLGYGETELSTLTAGLERWGMTLEGVARAAMEPGAPLFTNDQYRALAAMSNTEISLESGPVSSPRWFGNDLVAAFTPLLRWSFSKTGQLQKAFRDPVTGEQTANALTHGMAAMLLTVVPVAMMYAFMMDLYDRFLLGKKSNVRQFGQDNNLLAFIEQNARVGNFGLWGDLANTVANLGGGGDLRGISMDSRVVLLNSMTSLMQTANALIAQDAADYSTIYRPVLQSLGGSGYLQYAQIVNRATGDALHRIPIAGDLLAAEAKVTSRINVSNWLRAAGRELQMDVRQSTGRGGSTPTPTRPYISQMVLGALSQDSEMFYAAYQNALQEVARDFPDRDPDEYVRRAYSASNPLRTVFKTPPSETDYMMILSRLPDDGREDVAMAIELFNAYGESIGAKPFDGKEDEKPKARRRSSGGLAMASPFGF
jgi:hypothetical protein